MKKIIFIVVVLIVWVNAFAQDTAAVKGVENQSTQDTSAVKNGKNRPISDNYAVAVDSSADKQKSPDYVVVKEESPKQVMMNKFKHNWDLTVVLGTNMFLGEGFARYNSIFDAFSLPYLGVNIQKWLTPVWSIGMGVDYLRFKAICEKGANHYFANSAVSYTKDFQLVKISATGIYIKTSCHLANLIGGYRERMFHPIVYLGGGFLVPLNKMKYRPCGVTFNTGLLLNFQITKQFLLGINFEGDFVSDNFDGRLCILETSVDMDNIQFDAVQKIGIDFTYRFGYVKVKTAATGVEESLFWVPVQEMDMNGNQASANQAAKGDSLQKQLDQLQNTLAYTQNELALARIAAEKAHSDRDILISRDSISYWQVITFPVDTWTITNRERVNLMAAADMMKATPNVKYVITGYADEQTSTEEHNLFLSKKRAEAVYNQLVDVYGIPAAQLSKEFRGGVENLYYNDVECSRSVVIAPAK